MEIKVTNKDASAISRKVDPSIDLANTASELVSDRGKHEGEFLASQNIFQKKLSAEVNTDLKIPAAGTDPGESKELKERAEISNRIKNILQLDEPKRQKEIVKFLGNEKFHEYHSELYVSALIASYEASDNNKLAELGLIVTANKKTDPNVRMMALGSLPLSHSDGLKVAERVLKDPNDNFALREKLLGNTLEACTDGFIQSKVLARILNKIDPEDPLRKTPVYWLANLIVNNKQVGNDLPAVEIADLPIAQIAFVLKASETSSPVNTKLAEKLNEIIENPQTDPDIRTLLFKQVLVAPSLSFTKEYLRKFEEGELSTENQVALVKAIFDIQHVSLENRQVYSESIQKYFAKGEHPTELDLYDLYYKAGNPDPGILRRAMNDLALHKNIEMFSSYPESLPLSAATVNKCLENMGYEAMQEVYHELNDHRSFIAGQLRAEIAARMKAIEGSSNSIDKVGNIYELLSALKNQEDPELPKIDSLIYQKLSAAELTELKTAVGKIKYLPEMEKAQLLALAGDVGSLAKLTAVAPKDMTISMIDTFLKINIPATTEKLMQIEENGPSSFRRYLKDQILSSPEASKEYCQRIEKYQKWLELKNPEAGQKLSEYVQDLEAAAQFGITKSLRFSRQALHTIVSNRQSGPELSPKEERLAVLCLAESDHNGALVALNKDVLDLQARGYRVMLYEINQDFGEKSLEAAVKECGAKQKIDLLMIAGHGYRDAISLGDSDPRLSGERSERGTIERGDVGNYASLNPYLKDDSTIYLYSCSTNLIDPHFTDQHTIAGEFVRSFPNARRIIAAHATAVHVPLAFDYRDRVTEPEYSYSSVFRNIKGGFLTN